MNIKKALKYAEAAVPGMIQEALASEIKRLREQREQLVKELPLSWELQRETLAILNEVDTEKQEEKEEKKMTVDQAISEVENCRGATPQEIVLVVEVKRLHEIIERRDERIGELRTFLKRATGKLSEIRAMA